MQHPPPDWLLYCVDVMHADGAEMSCVAVSELLPGGAGGAVGVQPAGPGHFIVVTPEQGKWERARRGSHKGQGGEETQKLKGRGCSGRRARERRGKVSGTGTR